MPTSSHLSGGYASPICLHPERLSPPGPRGLAMRGSTGSHPQKARVRVTASSSGLQMQSKYPSRDTELSCARHSLAPRGLQRMVAANYIGVSSTKFDQLVAD